MSTTANTAYANKMTMPNANPSIKTAQSSGITPHNVRCIHCVNGSRL